MTNNNFVKKTKEKLQKRKLFSNQNFHEDLTSRKNSKLNVLKRFGAILDEIAQDFQKWI